MDPHGCLMVVSSDKEIDMDWEDMDVVVGVYDNSDRVGCDHHGNTPFSTDAKRDAIISQVAETCSEIIILEDSEWWK